MASYVDGDVSSGTTSLTDLSGLAWVAHGGDDLALFLLAFGDSTITLNSFDSAFTSVSQDLDTNVRSLVAKRTPASMTGSESGAIAAQCSAGNRQSGALGIWNGYADVQQIVSQPETAGTATATHACPPITPQVAGSAFVLAFVERVTNTAVGASTPAGFQKKEEFSTGGTGGTSVVLYDDLSGTHPVGTQFQPASIVSQLASTSARVYLLELAPASLSITLGLALETEAAQALASSKLATLSVATETDAAVALSASKAATLGLSAETDSALAVAVSKAVTLGLATETDVALAIAPAKAVTFGVATETDTALPLVATRGDAAFALATESDDAPAFGLTKLVTFGVATEADAALAISTSSIVGVVFDVAAEVDAAPALVASKQITLGVATETDSATPLVGGKAVSLATAAEVDAAFALIVGTAPPPEPGHLVATNTSAHLAPGNEPSSRLEASHDL